MNGGSVPYLAFVALAAGAAAIERRIALGNERRLRSLGAPEIAPAVYRAMVPAYVLDLAGSPIERVALGRASGPILFASMALLFLAAKALKAWVIVTLGRGWTMRVFVPASMPVVAAGPYRFLRHPNYVAVLAEVLAVPLAGGAVLTAAACGLSFVLLLALRVRSEEEALLRLPEYAARLGPRRRFLPGLRR